MAEDVNLADVLDTMNGPLNPEVTPEQVGPAVAAVLAYGGGDPVVVMPDGTLRRADKNPFDEWHKDCYFLADPVQP